MGKDIMLSQLEEESNWIQIGGAFSVSDMSFGLNIRYLELKHTIALSGELEGLPMYVRRYDSALALDFGALSEFGPVCKSGTKRVFSAGILIQDLNRPKLLNHEHVMNFRPGFGFRPSDNLLFSIEIYDLASRAFQKPQVRIGSEWVVQPFIFPGELALRGGVYHLNEKRHRALTGGVGYLLSLFKKAKVGFDYAFMFWDYSETLIHLFSFVYKF
jgi:hypothetical protein